MIRWMTFAALLATPALGQSLFLRAPTAPGSGGGVLGGVGAGDGFMAYSLFAIEAPEPAAFEVHDLVTILIDEASSQNTAQKIETDKTMGASANVNAILDPMQLLEARLRASTSTTNVDLIDADASSTYSGEGKSSRTDRFTAKVQGEIVDVKPNGNLVIEATTEIEINGERQTILLSGTCRTEDVTRHNTILSSQLAAKRLVMRTEGDVNDAGSKGVLTQVLDAIFAF